ncbi:NAD(P)-binding protein [Microstroma glucosiphilum]|uniref:NAD(P)-binding protein n=1 Tax=Pseudomicrostroma glucosiphilum TaxID=1684307 RepID=A0A316UH96_9BASI|nr:NAD(P)-binding protein [Pseudomicrostroma glucosiphilum]PWN22555.1 NAD(P)-binding protein [Pseudomicrostroma glucosiphilum]
MLALTGTTGRIGGATLAAILKYDLISPSELVILTSSSPSSQPSSYAQLAESGTRILQANYDDPDSLTKAFAEAKADRFFLVSTPAIQMDFNDAPHGQGREKAHFSAIDAAVAAGVKHIYYTSLAFADGSQAGVMRAHFRTEAYLKKLRSEGKVGYTFIREGLYNESWPLYLGHYKPKGDEREEIVVAGDGPVSWTSVQDLGIGTATIITDRTDRWKDATMFLSLRHSLTLKESLAIVDGKKSLKVVSSEEYIRHYEEAGMPRAMLEWWCTTYPSLEAGHARIQDGTLEEILAAKGKKPDELAETVRAMKA